MDNRNNPFEEKTNETQHTDLEKSQHDLIEDTEESTYKTEESPEGKPSDGETNAKDKKGSELKEWIKTIVIAVLIALFIRTFIFEVTQVDGISMNPTLENRDRIIVA